MTATRNVPSPCPTSQVLPAVAKISRASGATRIRRHQQHLRGQVVSVASGMIPLYTLVLWLSISSPHTNYHLPLASAYQLPSRGSTRPASLVVIPIRTTLPTRRADPSRNCQAALTLTAHRFPRGWWCSSSCRNPTRSTPLSLHASSSGDEDNEESAAGMADAFRQLEALNKFSLDDNDDNNNKEGSASTQASNTKRTLIDPTGLTAASSTAFPSSSSSSQEIPLEQEVKLYQNLVQDLEQNTDSELYSDVLADIMENKSSDIVTTSSGSSPKVSSASSDLSLVSYADNPDAFFDQALQEALKEAQQQDPSSSAERSSSSVWNDAELRKEIENIFDRGNDQLLASLEEIRQEQRELARISADESAQQAMNALEVDAQRLQQAEQSMQGLINRVQQESSVVEKAVQELKAAQKELDNDFLYKLKSGGPLKQASLIGFVLFALRSIVDTVAAITDPSHGMTVALIQGAIALVCAIVFFVL